MLASRLLTFRPIWSNIAISSKKYDAMLGQGGKAFLENLAVAARGAAVASGRHAGGPMKAAHEVRQIREPRLERHAGDSVVFVRQQLRGPAQASSNQILVRCDPQRAGEDPQVVIRTQPGPPRQLLQIDWLGGMGVDPQG